MPRNNLIQYRRGTAAEWTAANPVLADGEVGFDTTENQIRVGNGIHTWSLLAPIGGPAAEGITKIIALTQAEYDALPTPRPADILFAIKQS